MPYTYDYGLTGDNVTNVVLIDSQTIDRELIYNSCNKNTFAIIYDNDCLRQELLDILRIKFTLNKIDRLALIYAFPKNIFLENENLITNDTYTNSNNKSFLIDLLKEFNVENIDFLACNTLADNGYINFYNELNLETGVKVGASNDQTGNIKYGGDWVMESTNEDISSIYFSENIKYYENLLDYNSNFQVFIGNDNKIYGIGINSTGALGNGLSDVNVYNYTQMIPVEGKIPKLLAVLKSATVALMTDGTLYGTGLNLFNTLFDSSLNSGTNVLSEMPLPENKKVAHIVSSENALICLAEDGTVYGRGNNSDGILNSIDNIVYTWKKFNIPNDKRIKLIAIGKYQSIFLSEDNILYLSGKTAYGLFGNTNVTIDTTVNMLEISRTFFTDNQIKKMVLVGNPNHLKVELTSNSNYSVTKLTSNILFLTTDGRIYATGLNIGLQRKSDNQPFCLCFNSTTSYKDYSEPQLVGGEIGELFASYKFTDIFAGINSSFATYESKNNNNLSKGYIACGMNLSGELGNGSNECVGIYDISSLHEVKHISSFNTIDAVDPNGVRIYLYGTLILYNNGMYCATGSNNIYFLDIISNGTSHKPNFLGLGENIESVSVPTNVVGLPTNVNPTSLPNISNKMLNIPNITSTSIPSDQLTIEVTSPSFNIFYNGAVTATNSFNVGASTNNFETPIYYTSSDTSVATIDLAGQVTVLSTGTTTLTISQNFSTNYIHKSIQKTLIVNPHIPLEPTCELINNVNDIYGCLKSFKINITTESTYPIIYKSLTPTIATVNSYGEVKLNNFGIAKISVSQKQANGTIYSILIRKSSNKVLNVNKKNNLQKLWFMALKDFNSNYKFSSLNLKRATIFKRIYAKLKARDFVKINLEETYINNAGTKSTFNAILSLFIDVPPKSVTNPSGLGIDTLITNTSSGSGSNSSSGQNVNADLSGLHEDVITVVW